MQENADVAAAGQIDVISALIDGIDAGFEFIGIEGGGHRSFARRLKRGVRFDHQAAMPHAQLGEFAVMAGGLRRRFEPVTQGILVGRRLVVLFFTL